jgi:cytochrome c
LQRNAVDLDQLRRGWASIGNVSFALKRARRLLVQILNLVAFGIDLNQRNDLISIHAKQAISLREKIMLQKMPLLVAGALACVVFPSLALSAPASKPTSDDAEMIAVGRIIAEQNCSMCHSVGTSGVSPNPLSPPFRTLSQLYPIDDLQEGLAEGIAVGHPDMPRFEFSPRKIDALIAYLKSIQDKKWAHALRRLIREFGLASFLGADFKLNKAFVCWRSAGLGIAATLPMQRIAILRA